jgi:uncharacterized membrane protein YphA (DoxX/SURF4 family)
MFSHRFLYPTVSRILGLLLAVAAFLKARDWLGPVVDRDQQWSTVAAIAFEFLFGVWLLLGVYPRWSRLVALACFLVLLNVALWGVTSQRESCGCLGRKMPARPWAATALDGCAIAGLLLCAPFEVPGLTDRFRRWHGGVLGVSVVVIAALIAWPYLPKRDTDSKNSNSPEAQPTGVDSEELAQVIERLQNNRAALNTVSFSTEETSTQHPVEAWKRVLRGTDEEKKAFLGTSDRTMRSKCEYVYRGDEMRVECHCLQSSYHSDGKTDESNYDLLLVGSRGRMVKYIYRLEASMALYDADNH